MRERATMTKSLGDEEAERDDAIAAAAPNVLWVIDEGFWSWRVPSETNCFDGIIEGAPSKEERDSMVAEALAARAVWTPSEMALALVEKLREAIGHDVLVEPWDPIMMMLPAEGPYPILGRLLDVVIGRNRDGFEEAFLRLENPKEIVYPAGSRSAHLYLLADKGGAYLCSLAGLCRMQVLGP
jgi:hypothetical protein